MNGADHQSLRETILDMVADRGAEKTICPSEVARRIAGSDEKEWRKLMKPIRAAAVELAEEGVVKLKRKGRLVDPHDLKGIYRIGVPDTDA